MVAHQVMVVTWVEVGHRATVRETALSLQNGGRGWAVVVGRKGELAGLVRWNDLLPALLDGRLDARVTDFMTPADSLVTVCPGTQLTEAIGLLLDGGYDQLPVTDGKSMLGVITRQEALEALWREQAAVLSADQVLSSTVLNALTEGVIVVDRQRTIRHFNPAAEALTGLSAADRIGRKAVERSEGRSPVEEVLETGRALFQQETRLADGRTFLVNYIPLWSEGEVDAVLETFSDITKLKAAEQSLARLNEELDRAFALTLPNSKVEWKLKHSPEYRDLYDPEAGTIRILERLEAGTYHHIINCLKLAADLNEKGIMKQIGIEKDLLVQTIIFHDLGKSQPELQPGDVINPRDAFENGKAHASRGAEIARHFYDRSDDVVALIRYHHHEEHELPADFPVHLLPMYRLFRMIDGLSACMTRRGGEVHLEVRGAQVVVEERSNHPGLSRRWQANLLTGQTATLDMLPPRFN